MTTSEDEGGALDGASLVVESDAKFLHLRDDPHRPDNATMHLAGIALAEGKYSQ